MIDRYLSYVLIRAGKYVSTKAQAQGIAVCTFFGDNSMKEESRSTCHLLNILDHKIDIVWREFLEKDVQSKILVQTDGLLFDDNNKQLVDIINTLDSFTRAVLVFYHINRLSLEIIAEIFYKPVVEIRRALLRAQQELLDYLNLMAGHNDVYLAEDVSNKLNDLADALSWCRPEQIESAIFDYQ